MDAWFFLFSVLLVLFLVPSVLPCKVFGASTDLAGTLPFIINPRGMFLRILVPPYLIPGFRLILDFIFDFVLVTIL